MTRLAVFDMDGTLLFTLDDLTDACNYALSCSNYPARTSEDVRRSAGRGARNLARFLAPKELQENDAVIDRLVEDFSVYYMAHGQEKTTPYDGVIKMLRSLKMAGIRTAILSNKPDASVGTMSAHYFPGLIDLAYGQRQGVPIKPDPTPLLDVVSHFGFEKHDCCYIGDSEVDIATGLRADISTVGVAWGYRTIEQIKEAGAKVIAHKVEELLSILIDK